MDRKEAETSLKNDWYINNGNLIVEHDKVNRFLEACGMGIKALHEPERILKQLEELRGDPIMHCSEDYWEGHYQAAKEAIAIVRGKEE